jgi:mannose-1-phosphate guanylyltransferase
LKNEGFAMSYQTFRDEKLWSLVLAGGNGERLSSLVQHWLGRHKPKQYCTFAGTRSMFQHTLDRSDRIISPERRITIIARDHFDEAKPQFASRSIGDLILQPANRDTAAGIFLGVARVRAHDPDATVLIFPSDHFVYPEKRFVEITYGMARIAWSMKHWIFLLGVTPDGPEQEYGWIQPGAHLGLFDECRLRLTRVFLEKPTMANCRMAMSSGALWNTMVMAAKVETLWNLGHQFLPEVMSLFEVYSESIGSERENRVLEEIYQEMPKRNFSSHLLQQCPRQVLVMEANGVTWSDWGNPERIAATLRQFGHEPELCWARMAGAAAAVKPRAYTMGNAAATFQSASK